MIPEPGTHIDDFDTPALCVDLDIMERNIDALIARCKQSGIGWRPHTKSHKSPVLSQRLLKAGAMGITCAKLGEAEVMAAGGIRDILIANLIVGRHKLERLRKLRDIADPIVCVDHPDQVTALAAAFAESPQPLRILIEVDIGLQRVGAQPGPDVLALARQIVAAPGLELAGIMGYEGHLLCIEDLNVKQQRIDEALAVLVAEKDALERADVPCPIVSCGGTGSFQYAVQQPGITELQAGGGILMDAFYRHRCQVDQWEYALTVLATVVSRPAPERAIIDAGRKTMDGNLHEPLVLGREGIRITGLSAEHGQLQLEPSAQSLRIGDRLRIVPGYSDMTCVLHDHLFGLRNDRLEVVFPIAARGRLQ